MATKAPQDRKPKAKETKEPSGVVTAELDGMEVTADFSHIRNVRLLRRMRRGDMTATIEFMEKVFGDQTDEVEEHFKLETDEDWGEFFQRVAEAGSPNS